MKNKIVAFLVCAIAILAFLPALNFYKWSGNNLEYFKAKDFYSLDHVMPGFSGLLYRYGISLFPSKAIVGNEGWLFLGDDYNATVTAKRNGVTESDIVAARRSVDAMLAWRSYMQANGVKDFKIWVGPDKASVYPELAPSWAVMAKQMKVDAITDFDEDGMFVNPREHLLNERGSYIEPLYYSSDTHWNSLGAWAAFEYYMNDLSLDHEIIFELEQEAIEVRDRSGGDLSRFLRIAERTHDTEVLLSLNPDADIDIQQYDYATGGLISEGGNPPIDSPREAIRVVSDNAANQAKVVWLRDSFGTAMSPYMAAMFSETVQLHYGHANSEWLANAVKEYQPDYVFITVVERALPGGFFMTRPPLEAVALGSLEYQVAGRVVALHHVDSESGGYEIIGNDPFVVYRFDEPLATRRFSHVSLDLSCEGESKENVRVQVFWGSPGAGGFSESKSVKFTLPQGGAVFDLTQVGSWSAEDMIDRIRVDIEAASIDTCRTFSLRDAEAGHL